MLFLAPRYFCEKYIFEQIHVHADAVATFIEMLLFTFMYKQFEYFCICTQNIVFAFPWRSFLGAQTGDAKSEKKGRQKMFKVQDTLVSLYHNWRTCTD